MSQQQIPGQSFQQVMQGLETGYLEVEERRILQEREAREALRRRRDMAEHRARTYRSPRVAGMEQQTQGPVLLPSSNDAQRQAEKEKQDHDRALKDGLFPPPPTGPT